MNHVANIDVFRRYEVDSWPEAREKLLSILSEGQRIIFRGQANARWPLVSSLGRVASKLRQQKTDASLKRRDFIPELEKRLVTAFEDACLHIPSLPPLSFPDENERVAYAQHYSLPTRYLDWSTSPYVAAFFAFDGSATSVFNPKHKVAIWAFDCEQADLLHHYKYKNITPIDESASHPDDVADTMAVMRRDNQPRLDVIHIRGNPNRRLVYQQGVFTCAIDVEDNVRAYLQRNSRFAAGTVLTRVDVPACAQGPALKDLFHMWITAGILMHDPDGAAATAFNEVVRFRSDWSQLSGGTEMTR